MDDVALTIQLKQGNQLAFTILYNTYSDQAYRLAFKYLCNKELAEDAVQNLFMKIWTKREDLDERRPLNHFLFTVLKNDILNILRDSRNNIFVLDDCLELLERIDDDQVDDEIDREQLDMIRRAIDQLSPQRRKVGKGAPQRTDLFHDAEFAADIGIELILRRRKHHPAKRVRHGADTIALSHLPWRRHGHQEQVQKMSRRRRGQR